MIAGLVTPNDGEICIQNKPITNVPPYKRNIGMVFQDYALFPHMTVFDNIAFGLSMKHWNKSRIKARVKELLDLISLPEISNRYPARNQRWPKAARRAGPCPRARARGAAPGRAVVKP